jgi:tRNA 2-thiouridine synthesizing protein E
MYDTLNLVHINEPSQLFGNIGETEIRASEMGITLSKEHWEAINFIRKFYEYQENEPLSARDISRALEGKFKSRGGLKYLYQLFPQGPVKTGSYIAGIPALNNADNRSFGSVL